MYIEVKNTNKVEAEEIAQWSLAALAEDRGSIPSTHLMPYDCLCLQFLIWPL